MQQNHSLFLFLFFFTTYANTFPIRRWSKLGSTGSIANLGLVYISGNLLSSTLGVKFVCFSSSTSNPNWSFLFFASIFYLFRYFKVLCCFFREGNSSLLKLSFLFLELNPPSKVISISSSLFLYFLLQLFLQSEIKSLYLAFSRANFAIWSSSSIWC